MSIKKTFALILLTLAANSVLAQKSQKMEVLSLDCQVTGKLTTQGLQYTANLDKDVATRMSVLIGNGVISIQDIEDMFSIDVPVIATSNDFAGTQRWQDNKGTDFTITVNINRSTGVIRATREAVMSDGKRLNIKTSGNCEKASNKKKF